MTILRRDLTTIVPWPDGTGQMHYRIQAGWRQARPGVVQDVPLPYACADLRCVKYATLAKGNAAYAAYTNRFPGPAWNDWRGERLGQKTASVHNQAVSRFQELIGQDASLGAALATVPESFAMIATRLGSFASSYRNLRKGRFKDAIADLNVRPLPQHKKMKMSRPKDASALWLEYWFGWAPMIGDIYDACSVVCSEFPPVLVKGTASLPFTEEYVINRWRGQAIDRVYGKIHAKAQAKVVVSNPNLYLLGKLGLLNPATIAWELVPFSFMVDWFGNIGDVLNDWTAYAGLTLTDSFTTVAMKSVIVREENYVSGGIPEAYISHHRYGRMQRTLGAPKHRLHFEIPGAPSATRAATAASLAALIFGKG